MPEQGHQAATLGTAAQRRVDDLETAIAPFVTRRLAGWWSLRVYPDFRKGQQTPRDAAAESDEGLAEALEYVKRIGPAIKGTDWSGSGWVGKGRRRARK